jgi:hypothetical protein
MQILKLADVDEVLGLDQCAEELKMGSSIGFARIQVEFLPFSSIV